jgi:hypothetical protein
MTRASRRRFRSHNLLNTVKLPSYEAPDKLPWWIVSATAHWCDAQADAYGMQHMRTYVALNLHSWALEWIF